jgi:S1-C subfamily serine protease
MIQITAPISHGSSGGPVFNIYGEVIGISTSTLSSGQSLNFAVPASAIDALLEQASSK